MKFTIAQSNLATHLAQVVPIVPIRPTHPALGNILIDASHHRVSLTAFDLSIKITASFANGVDQEGTITAPGRLMASLVDALPHKTLRLHLKESEQLEIGCEEANYQIQGIKSREFPQLPSLEGGNRINLEAKTFLNALIPVLSAYATDPAKQVLTGIRFALTEGSLQLSSTDAHRLAVTRLSLLNQGTGAFTVPATALEHLAKLLKTLSEGETVAIEWDEVQIKFSIPNIELISRLLEGAYPDVNQLIPTDFQRTHRFVSQPMQAALNRLLLLQEKNKAPIIKLDSLSSLGQIDLSLLNGEGKTGIESIPAQIPADSSIAFNGKYLLEALKALPGKELQLLVNESIQPAILQAQETELATAQILLMPCEIKPEIEPT